MIPSVTGQYYPPLTTFGNDSNMVISGRVYGNRPEMGTLHTAGMREFYGMTPGGPGGGNPDDETNIIATQVFGP